MSLPEFLKVRARVGWYRASAILQTFGGWRAVERGEEEEEEEGGSLSAIFSILGMFR